jgi:NAD(P)-dependent dehydrogenase (short-subunit alcohol dehydrogenase family)
MVVTGATRGIGRALALRLAHEGAALVLAGKNGEALRALAAELAAAGTSCLAVPGDLSRGSEVVLALAAAAEGFGPIDALVNNAGLAHRAALAETSEAIWDETLGVNLKAPYLLTRALLPGMLARGRGRIVNVCSISSVVGTPSLTAYCASKWALLGFSKALARELEGTGVSVTAVLPGSTDTDMLRGSGFPAELSPDQVARIIAFLAGLAPTAMNGAAFELFD